MIFLHLNHSSRNKLRSQQGATTLLVAMLLLTVMTTIAVMAIKGASTEQRVSNNYTRANQAFAAAEGGLQQGIIYFQHDSNAIFSHANKGFINGYVNPIITDVMQSDGTQYSVAYSNLAPNDFSIIAITATGKSADGSVNRTIRQQLTSSSLIANKPISSLSAKGSVALGGESFLSNAFSIINVWSGGPTTFTANSISSCGNLCQGSNKNFLGLDIFANDPALQALSKDQFFEFFFRSTPSGMQTAAKNIGLYFTKESPDLNAQLNNAAGKLIWIEAPDSVVDLDANMNIGSATEPVVLIVNGGLRINGTVNIYGEVYVFNSIAGNVDASIHGALITPSNISSDDLPKIYFDPAVLDIIAEKFKLYSTIPGSWYDF